MSTYDVMYTAVERSSGRKVSGLISIKSGAGKSKLWAASLLRDRHPCWRNVAVTDLREV